MPRRPRPAARSANIRIFTCLSITVSLLSLVCRDSSHCCLSSLVSRPLRVCVCACVRGACVSQKSSVQIVPGRLAIGPLNGALTGALTGHVKARAKPTVPRAERTSLASLADSKVFVLASCRRPGLCGPRAQPGRAGPRAELGFRENPKPDPKTVNLGGPSEKKLFLYRPPNEIGSGQILVFWSTVNGQRRSTVNAGQRSTLEKLTTHPRTKKTFSA